MLNKQWLAGFFDAEGSVSFNYKPNLDLVNTSATTMFQIKDLLNILNINIGMNEREKPSKSSKRPRWDIFLRHEEQIKPFLTEIGPYIQGKQFQLHLVQEWYEKPFDGLKQKIQFANQVHNKIILNTSKVMQKLGVKKLDMYDDIPVLTDEDSYITTDNSFNDMDYLAGLLDGEGTINMHYRASKRSSLGRYTPQVLFNNTDKVIVKRYCSVLVNNNIPYHISFRKAGTTSNRKRWDIIVSGVKRSERLC
ncbi:hypothetical protein LCGC14_3009180, partial [marine sediment metagenome]